MSKFLQSTSRHFRHWFHVVSNIRPLVWMSIYIVAIPIFALVYLAIPAGQFRIPDGGGVDFGSWLYYSIVTITTLGFGDYTPCGWIAQWVTALEVMTGLLCLGFFLNAVGSMKSEIDVESEIEKQKRVHEAKQKELLSKMSTPILRLLHAFVNHCNTVESATKTSNKESAVSEMMKSAARSALALDALQRNVDLTLWPNLLEDCFTFVASYQILASEVGSVASKLNEDGSLSDELKTYVTDNSALAQRIEDNLTREALPEA